MKDLKIKISTIARIGALAVVLINQCLAIFGKEALPITESMTYQIISLAATVVVAAINCWYDQDITLIALLTGRIFDAFKDGKITEEEIASIVQFAKNEEKGAADKDYAFLIGLANGIIANLKNKAKK